MPEHCDRCGTELVEDQRRHQHFEVEHASDPEQSLEGRLCSDCFWAFTEFLETRSVEAADP